MERQISYEEAITVEALSALKKAEGRITRIIDEIDELLKK
jgi:hypothetical protein